MMELPFQQTFVTADLAVIGLLIVLEGVLSIDNALVLGLLAKRLPKSQQGRALTYGLIGAFVFRFIAIATAAWLLHYRIVKLIGGGYLLYVAGKYFWSEYFGKESEKIALNAQGEPVLVDQESGKPLPPEGEEEELQARAPVPLPGVEESQEIGAPPGKYASFWPTVLVIELTDIAFAIDSILAAIALVGGAPAGHVGPHPKLWVVISGGMLGVILMRFAAVVFIKLLERFPRFEVSAFLLVAVIGVKLTADWALNAEEHVLDFHSPRHWAFWTFWALMLACLSVGFIPKKGGHASTSLKTP
jgi:YkoY family integral membrane protein